MFDSCRMNFWGRCPTLCKLTFVVTVTCFVKQIGIKVSVTHDSSLILFYWLGCPYLRLIEEFYVTFSDESRNRELKQVNLFWYRSCWLSFIGGKVPKVGAHIPAMGSLVLYLILKKVLLRNEILFKTEESMIYVNDDFHAIILILFFCQPAHHTI